MQNIFIFIRICHVSILRYSVDLIHSAFLLHERRKNKTKTKKKNSKEKDDFEIAPIEPPKSARGSDSDTDSDSSSDEDDLADETKDELLACAAA
jgi:hypothetical protein